LSASVSDANSVHPPNAPTPRAGDELSADAAVPGFRDDEPALEETYTIGLAALGVRSDGELGKTQQT